MGTAEHMKLWIRLHFFLWSWFIIFSGSITVSELQEICCELNACTIVTATFQEPKQPQKLTIWNFVSTLFAGADMSTGSEGYFLFAFCFSLYSYEQERETLRSKLRIMLWSAESHQGWRRVRRFQGSLLQLCASGVCPTAVPGSRGTHRMKWRTIRTML